MATDRKNKKRFIVLLLLASCLSAAYLLFYYPAGSGITLDDPAEADSLIREQLEAFSIPDSQVSERIITVDTVLKRKNYYVSVPPGFSKTQLHAELAHLLHPYNISAPAKVIFPQKDLLIQLTFRNTVIRSIRVQTDPDLQMIRNPASIMVAFDGRPDHDLLEEVISMGEPISVVLKVDNAVQAKELQNELSGRYPHISFWLRDDLERRRQSSDGPSILPKLQDLRKVSTEAPILTMNTSDELFKSLDQSGMDLINISNAQILNSNVDRASFLKAMKKFEQQARNRRHPIALVAASDNTVRWLEQELRSLKKGGLTLTLPPKSAP